MRMYTICSGKRKNKESSETARKKSKNFYMTEAKVERNKKICLRTFMVRSMYDLFFTHVDANLTWSALIFDLIFLFNIACI